MIINRDIIIVGQQSWDTEIGSNCKNIALEFSKHNRVLYVSTPLDRISKIRNKGGQNTQAARRLSVIEGKSPQLELVSPNLWVWYHDVMIESINWIGNEWLFDHINKRNNKKLANSIKKGIEILNFKDYILFNDGDMFRSFYLKEQIAPSVTVYYLRDNYHATSYWKKHAKVWEPRLIAKSDICMTNSFFLGDYCALHNSNVHYVGQGCDLTLFSRNQKIPEEMKMLKQQGKKIVGYVGALLEARLDKAMLEHLALQNPHLLFVFVGPEDEAFKSSKLHELFNVHFISAKKPEELPGYISAFDVCINPQIVNALTIGNYPRKIDEYLALGKPVVATQTKAMEMFESHVFLAENLTDYHSLIQEALMPQTDSQVQSKIEFAHSHSWENSIKEIYRVINDTEKI